MADALDAWFAHLLMHRAKTVTEEKIITITITVPVMLGKRSEGLKESIKEKCRIELSSCV